MTLLLNSVIFIALVVMSLAVVLPLRRAKTIYPQPICIAFLKLYIYGMNIEYINLTQWKFARFYIPKELMQGAICGGLCYNVNQMREGRL